jgi:Spy/CpxP family protein refolding chaperone
MKKSIVSIIIVFSLSIFLAGFSYSQEMNRPENNRPIRQKMGMMGRMDLMKKLNLTDQQKQKFADMRIAFQKKMVDLKADLKKNKLDLEALKIDGNLNRNDVIAAVEKVNKSSDAITVAFANHMLDMYEVLTPDQQKIWKENAPKFGNMRQHFRSMMRPNRMGQRGMMR